MLNKIIRNPAKSVVGQLRIIVAVLSIFAIFNLVVIYRKTHGMIGDSRVVNYTGIVRGNTQRLVKLAFTQQQLGDVTSNNQEDSDETEPEDQPEEEQSGESNTSSNIEQKINDTIPELNQIINGLINGDEELELERLEDPDFQSNMEQLQQAWEQLKVDLENFLNNPSPQHQARLLQASEAYWDLTNEATFSAETYAKQNVQNSERLAVILFIVNLIILGIIVMISETLRAKLKDTVTSLTTSSTEIAATVAEQERIASQQAVSVNETTTTMDELEASSRHAAEQANAAVEAAKHAFTASEDGERTVGESIEGMFTLEKKVEAIAEQIVNLSSQASQIGNISQLVVDFANQTNMLALNSSVEAVRAGEHGKGFAVVAQEVRKLADQSQQSADKINNLVSEIQKSINTTVMVTEEGTKTVKAGVQIAKQTEEAFGEIKTSVNQVVLNNQQVSLNLKQQVNAIQQVVDAMEAINRGSKETASGLGQTKAGTAQLNEAAIVLQKMV